MERGRGGESWRQDHFGTHLQDEQASSDEEGFPLDQNGHPTIVHNSIYSRIQEEVQSRLPSIDFGSFEVNDETEDAVIGKYWPPGDIDRALNVQGFVERLDNDIDGHPAQSLSERTFSVANSDWSREGNTTESDHAVSECSSSCIAIQNCVSERSTIGDSMVAALSSNDIIGNAERVSDQEMEARRTVETEKNDLFGKVLSIDKTVKSLDDMGSGHITLETDIDERNLDIVLGLDASLIDAGNLPKLSSLPLDISTVDDDDDDECDDDSPLLDKLSSFAVSEKNSVCESSILLEQLATPHGVRKDTGTNTDLILDGQIDGSQMSSARKGSLEGGNKTVFIDLRNSCQQSSVKNNQETTIPKKEDSSSDSENEEWMKIRQDIKSGLSVQHSRKLDGHKEGKSFENKVHDRMTRRSYEKLAELTSKINYDYILKRHSNSVDHGTSTEVTRSAGNAAFDVGPLEEKIRSWHQLGNNSHNKVYSLLGDIRFGGKNMICREEDTCSCENRDIAERSVGAVENVRQVGTSTRRENTLTAGAVTGEHVGTSRTLVNDSSLLGLENVDLKSGIFRNARKSLLIVDENKQGDDRESCCGTSEQCTKMNPTVELIGDDSKRDNSGCYIEELADKIRISDNLMVIKADISADLQNSQVTSTGPESMNQYSERNFNEMKELEAGVFESVLDDPTAADNCRRNEGDSISCLDSRTSREHCCGMFLIGENEKNLLTNSSSQRDIQAGSAELETEMKTFSIAESTKCSFASGGEEMADVSSTLKGLLPQYGHPMLYSALNCSGQVVVEGREHERIEKEIPVIDRQLGCMTSSAESNGGHEAQQDNETVKREGEMKKTTDTKVENSVHTTGWDMKVECGQSRNKKKSKKKNRRGADNIDDKEMIEKRNIDGKKVSKNNIDLKLAKNVGNIEKEIKRKPVCLVRESERTQIEGKIKQLQEQIGEADVIFDEKLSFTHAFKSLPNSPKEGAKLLLKIRLQSPGVCSKSCAKNSLSFNERSDAYIGLCTLFLSLLHGSKFRVCDGLNIPFNVIALKQATIDSELQLLVGIVEYEIPTEATQQVKRGKPAKVKKNFYQSVTQYLNKTDLEKVLSGLMKFDYMQRDGPTASCPGARKLSSYITVSQDEAAVSRIFNLKPSLVWCRSDEIDHQACHDVCWMKGKQRRNETTCVIVENIASMLPRTIATFMRTARNKSLDICGLRIAYITKKDQSEEPTLVTAFRGPNVTTVNDGKSFTADAQELKSVKSTYMLWGFESLCEDLKEVTVSASAFLAPFNVTIAEPLITYTIGRGHGEREVVNWFGRRILTLADADPVVDQAKEITSNSTSLPEKLDVLSRHVACAGLLTITTNRIVLSMSHFVPTVFISLAMTSGELHGLHAMSAGKILLKEEDMLLMGLKTDSGEDISVGNKSKIGKVNQSVSVVVFEGENPMYRAYGFVRSLFDTMNGKLPRDAMTKDVVVQTLRESTGYELVRQDRSIEEFFGIVQLHKKVIKVLERMTAQNLSHLDNEVMNALPPNWKLFMLPETPRICAAIFVGKPMLEIFPYILQVLLSECLEDPFCTNAKASTERKYRQQERPVAEIIGLKCYANLSKHIAHVCCPYVVGAKHWATSVENLRNGPVVVVVLRLLDTITSMDEKCRTICRQVCTLLRSNRLNCSPDSVYDAFSYTHLDTVFRVLLGMFNVDELMPDACPTWFKSTQWPVYLSSRSSVVKRINPILGFLTNTHQLHTFRSGIDAIKANPTEVRILSPLEMNLPAELILGKQVSLSFMEITVDYNFSKYVPRLLGILRRDMFDVVGLNFPSGFSPSFVSFPTIHVVLRRPDAVFRLNQWLPELRAELPRSHSIKISLGAKEAFDAIVRHFQKTESGGIFDDSSLSTTEKLTFKNDDIYDCREYSRVHWRNDPNSTVSSTTDSRQHVRPDSNRGFVMPEINVLVITSVMMRGTYLDDYISENAKVLGFWEHIASLGFKIIGARMTSLRQEQVDGLLQKLKLPSKHHRLMEKRMPASNGPIVALVVLRDFALSNFWNTVTKNLTEEECRIIRENVLIPTTKNQVEILASSLFETLAPNPEIEIKRISTLKELHVVS